MNKSVNMYNMDFDFLNKGRGGSQAQTNYYFWLILLTKG